MPLVKRGRDEGTVLQSHRDPIGIVTACVGAYRASWPALHAPARKTCCTGRPGKHAQALDCIKQPVHLTDGSKAAFVSFAFKRGEQGAAAFDGSTMRRKAAGWDMWWAPCRLKTRAGTVAP